MIYAYNSVQWCAILVWRISLWVSLLCELLHCASLNRSFCSCLLHFFIVEGPKQLKSLGRRESLTAPRGPSEVSSSHMVMYLLFLVLAKLEWHMWGTCLRSIVFLPPDRCKGISTLFEALPFHRLSANLPFASTDRLWWWKFRAKWYLKKHPSNALGAIQNLQRWGTKFNCHYNSAGAGEVSSKRWIVVKHVSIANFHSTSHKIIDNNRLTTFISYKIAGCQSKLLKESFAFLAVYDLVICHSATLVIAKRLQPLVS